MTAVTPEPVDLAALTRAASKTDHAFLSAMGPVILAACATGIAKDTRRFARAFDIAHALVLRECVHLESELGLITRQSTERVGRVFYELTPAGRMALGLD